MTQSEYTASLQNTTSLSIIILTKNEELDLPGCLASIQWCDDIHVVDSGSTDNTVAIAVAAGAHVSYHTFESFGKQRNWALDNCPLLYQWVLFLDADERSTDEFKFAILRSIHGNENMAGFYCCWKLMLYGRWLRFTEGYPKWQFRLLKLGMARFIDYGHGQKEGDIKGEIGYIREPYLHYAFSKGWANWIDKHNRYSTLEATERARDDINWPEVFSIHKSSRNKALKPLVSRLPGWPIIYFTTAYFFRLGFIEGWPALVYCINMTYYEFLIQIKLDELKRGE